MDLILFEVVALILIVSFLVSFRRYFDSNLVQRVFTFVHAHEYRFSERKGRASEITLALQQFSLLEHADKMCMYTKCNFECTFEFISESRLLQYKF